MAQDDWLDADVVRSMDIDRKRKERRGGPDRIQRLRDLGQGGGGRGRPPISTGFPQDDDDDPERSALIAQIEEIMETPALSTQQKIREILYLLGIKQRHRGS